MKRALGTFALSHSASYMNSTSSASHLVMIDLVHMLNPMVAGITFLPRLRPYPVRGDWVFQYLSIVACVLYTASGLSADHLYYIRVKKGEKPITRTACFVANNTYQLVHV